MKVPSSQLRHKICDQLLILVPVPSQQIFLAAGLIDFTLKLVCG